MPQKDTPKIIEQIVPPPEQSEEEKVCNMATSVKPCD